MFKIKNRQFPRREALEILKKYKQVEACAILNKKIGNYYEAVKQFKEVILKQLNIRDMKNELLVRGVPDIGKTRKDLQPRLF